MTQEETNRIIKALKTWAQGHETWDEPFLLIAGAGSYTPIEIVEEVEKRTPVGLLQLRVFQHACDTGVTTVETIVRSLNGTSENKEGSY